MEKKRTTVYISQSAWNKLRHLALDKKKSASQLLEEILEERLRKEK
jgi:predicted DNA-binding ribbon-helix-helix protein